MKHLIFFWDHQGKFWTLRFPIPLKGCLEHVWRTMGGNLHLKLRRCISLVFFENTFLGMSSTDSARFLYKKNFNKKMRLKISQKLKKILRKSPVSNN